MEELQRKQREEVNECKERILIYQSEWELVENERESLQSSINELEKSQIAEKEVTFNNNSVYKDKFVQLEAEYDSLAEACELLRDELTEVSKMNLQHELKIADLEDRLLCAQINLESKCVELEEKNEMGNSSSFEFDDRCQKLKAVFVARKAKFIKMENRLEQSQRENAAMYKEMEICSHTDESNELRDQLYRCSLEKVAIAAENQCSHLRVAKIINGQQCKLDNEIICYINNNSRSS
ncbi:hypothetical protein Bhyg_14486, partial [Pseudolycoriella hygida]